VDASVRVNEVPAGDGIRWLKDAFALYRQAPLAWIGLCAGWLVIWFLLLNVPFLGPVLGNLLQPVFFGSFAIAAYKQAAGERIGFNELFSGFRRNARALVNVGLIMMLAQLASAYLMKALGLPTWPEGQPFDLMAYAEMLQGSRWVIAAGFFVMAIASGALWYAPQLIVFHGMSTSHAIRWSLYAALANFGAMAVYGIVLVFLLVIAWIPLALGLLVMLPVMVISTYTGYRAVFETVTPGTDPELPTS
jgi:hypothetical protein